MLNPFQEIKKIEVRRFASLPAHLRKKQRTAWSDPNRQGAAVDSFLEGPSFDREGNLWCVDIPFGRVFRLSPKGDWELVVQYEGWPNGLKFHRDGAAWITDYRKGLLRLDPQSGRIEPILETAFSESFKGLNDLHFADNGDVYFTDQGQSGIADPSGRVYRLRANGELQRLISNAPSPNGITLNKKNSQVYVAITRAQQIWRLPLMEGGMAAGELDGDAGLRRHRDRRRGRARRVPSRRGHLAVRFELPADASGPRRCRAPAHDEHRVPQQDALHHRLAQRRDPDRRDAGRRQSAFFDEVKS
jgi:streptogramin lyase